MDCTQKVKSAIETCHNIDDNGISILSGDTDKVKSYVYSSTRLPEMRGASIILDELNQEKTEKIFRDNSLKAENLLFNKGGSLLALVPTLLGEKIKEEIKSLYLQETHGLASITVVTEPVKIEQLYNEFPKIIKRLSNRIKQEKEQKCLFPVYEVIPYARRCHSCGLRPANIKQIRQEREEYLCKSCQLKKLRGEYRAGEESSGKTRFFNEFIDYITEGNNRDCLRRIFDCCISNARDLAEISDENGYIGVIYADGNEIGSKIESLEKPEHFVEFSEHIFKIIKKSLYSSVADYISPKKVGLDNRCILPIEIVSIGGDDLFIILPANIALQVANRLCENFENEVSKSSTIQLKDATLSVGVIIAKENFPIYYIYDLVDQTLKNAKKKAKSDNEIKTAIDFMVFKSQGGEILDINKYRSQILRLGESIRIQGVYNSFRLTFRPYFKDEFDKLLSFVKRLNQENFSKSKLFNIRESIEMGREYSTLQYLYLISKASETEKFLLRSNFADNFMDRDISFIPWRKIGKTEHGYIEYRTPIVDIIEIFDFVS
ncbi:hypothetical protein GF312_03140 [Candidatus Poribacteria bacterium]|nr:hypothetical protein [Candidatus Poribacteria bacterium]